MQSRGRGLAFIDEVELQASSLCSAYSYIASVFQDLFVWYGRGTPDEESRVALQYAEELAKATPGPKRKVAHMLEGAESDLWKDIMGHEEEYAFANVGCLNILTFKTLADHGACPQHWRFRLDNPAISQTVPQFYEVSESNPAAAVSHSLPVQETTRTYRRVLQVRWLGDETACSLSDGSVYILRTPVECFVLVTPSARGNGKSIALHMQAALNMLKTNPLPGVPFRPTLHALILPSLIPKDLQAAMRSSHLEDLVSRHIQYVSKPALTLHCRTPLISHPR